MHLLTILAFSALGIVALLLLLVLFEPPLRYDVKAPDAPLDSDDFLRLMGALADSQLHRTGHIELLSDGHSFYPAELDAIRNAQRSVHLEAFIFHPSPIGDRFRDALVERARAGVHVKVVVDTVGSLPTPRKYFDPLIEAGGQVRWYQPLHFGTLKRMNNRTHRELLVIDGRIGFVGGAGIANHWDVGDANGKPPWRDMMFRVHGGLAEGLQTTFAENWLESSGQILAYVQDFPSDTSPPHAPTAGFVVLSTPTAGRSSRNRIVFQTLIASARASIRIHSPYFLPDRSATRELVRAVSERGVKIQVIVPGSANNHRITRLASRRRYGPLLKAGVEIYEYQPGMIHTKAMSVDQSWIVVGSTNFDSRSFDLNDEVNLVAIDAELAASIEREFAADLSRSKRITYEEWERRSLLERVAAQLGRVVERQE
jgi:cardiolipin synthase A/B